MSVSHITQVKVYDLTKQERELAFGYIVSILLKSRIACGKSDDQKYRDDVDVYIASLLLSLTDPKAQERNIKYIFMTDAELVTKIENCRDNFVKYLIYKTNADNIIMSLSMFDIFHLRDKRGRVSNPQRYRAFQGRGKIYYELASTYHHKVYRKQTGICDALDKLSEDFEEYLEIMIKMKREFFSFFDQMCDTKFDGFLDSLKQYAHELIIEKKTDQFLDAYSAWKKKHTRQNEKCLKDAVRELEIISPSFTFDLKRILSKS